MTTSRSSRRNMSAAPEVRVKESPARSGICPAVRADGLRARYPGGVDQHGRPRIEFERWSTGRAEEEACDTLGGMFRGLQPPC